MPRQPLKPESGSLGLLCCPWAPEGDRSGTLPHVFHHPAELVVSLLGGFRLSTGQARGSRTSGSCWPRGSPVPSPNPQAKSPSWHRGCLATSWLKCQGERAAKEGPGGGEGSSGSGPHPSPSSVLGWASSSESRPRVSNRGPQDNWYHFRVPCRSMFLACSGRVMGLQRGPLGTVTITPQDQGEPRWQGWAQRVKRHAAPLCLGDSLPRAGLAPLQEAGPRQTAHPCAQVAQIWARGLEMLRWAPVCLALPLTRLPECLRSLGLPLGRLFFFFFYQFLTSKCNVSLPRVPRRHRADPASHPNCRRN